jgi:hypothetical protein
MTDSLQLNTYFLLILELIALKLFPLSKTPNPIEPMLQGIKNKDYKKFLLYSEKQYSPHGIYFKQSLFNGNKHLDLFLEKIYLKFENARVYNNELEDLLNTHIFKWILIVFFLVILQILTPKPKDSFVLSDITLLFPLLTFFSIYFLYPKYWIENLSKDFTEKYMYNWTQLFEKPYLNKEIYFTELNEDLSYRLKKRKFLKLLPIFETIFFGLFLTCNSTFYLFFQVKEVVTY